MNTETFCRNLEVPTRPIDVVLDTDAYNEIDDQFAIAYLLRMPERANVKGLTAAPISEYDHRYADAPERHGMRYVDYVNRDALMEDLIRRLTAQ